MKKDIIHLEFNRFIILLMVVFILGLLEGMLL